MRLVSRLLVLTAVLGLAFSPSTATFAADLPKRITFATFPVGSGNYAIGNALAKVASENGPIMVVTRPGASASAWVGTCNDKGLPEIGLVHILDAWWAFSGKLSPEPLEGDPYGVKPFYNPNPNLRMLIGGPSMWVGPVARADKDWKYFSDAKGSKLAGGFSAHPGAYAGLVALLAADGLSEARDFNLISVATSNASVKAFAEGRADLALGSVGNAAITEANATKPVRFLNVSSDPESVRKAQKAFPGARIATYTGRTSGIAEDTTMLTYPMVVVTSTHLSDDTAYTLTKTWWENYEKTWPIYAGCQGWEAKDFVIRNATIPYHDGAIRFFKEVGAWDADMDRIQSELLAGGYPFLN